MKNLKQKLLLALSFITIAVLMTACASQDTKTEFALNDFKLIDSEFVFDKLHYDSNLDTAKNTFGVELSKYTSQNDEVIYQSDSKIPFNNKEADIMLGYKNGKLNSIAFSITLAKDDKWLEETPKILIESFGNATNQIGDYTTDTYPTGLQWTVGYTTFNYQLMQSGEDILCTMGIHKQ